MGRFLNNALGTNNAYTAVGPGYTLQNFQPGLTNSLNQYNQAYGQEGQLAGALTAEANGTGPNPAQQQLQQATNQNIKQNAGFIASQKGINPALAQREAAENQSSIGQQAAGQGALMGAQQQLSAQGQLAGLYGNQVGQSAGLQNIQQNAQSAQNNAIVNATNSQNQVNSGASAQNASTSGGLVGGLLGGAAGALHTLGFAKGGEVPGYAPGGYVGDNVNWGYGGGGLGGGGANMAAQYIDSGGKALNTGISAFGNIPKPAMDGGPDPFNSPNAQTATENANLSLPGTSTLQPNASYAQGGPIPYQGMDIPDHMQHMLRIFHPEAHAKLAKGGKVPAMVSPGEIYLDPKKAKEVAEGKARATEVGKKVPGKPKVMGNSYTNDIVKTKLSPGGFVIPDSITESKNVDENAKNFVASKLSADSHEGFHEALKKAIASRGKR